MWALYHSHFAEAQAHNGPSSEISAEGRIWKMSRFRLISEMLIAAGSPVPEIESNAGDYDFLLTIGMNKLLAVATTENFNHKATIIFQHFNFWRGVGGQGACLMYNSTERKVALFPTGAPMMTYQHPSRRNSAIKDDGQELCSEQPSSLKKVEEAVDRSKESPLQRSLE
jgi:hypothetical protein